VASVRMRFCDFRAFSVMANMLRANRQIKYEYNNSEQCQAPISVGMGLANADSQSVVVHLGECEGRIECSCRACDVIPRFPLYASLVM
jgi:hypothetical protein